MESYHAAVPRFQHSPMLGLGAFPTNPRIPRDLTGLTDVAGEAGVQKSVSAELMFAVAMTAFAAIA